MITCSVCKTENDDKNVVCKKCGNVIGDIPELDFTEIVKRKKEKVQLAPKTKFVRKVIEPKLKKQSNEDKKEKVGLKKIMRKKKANRFIFYDEDEK